MTGEPPALVERKRRHRAALDPPPDHPGSQYRPYELAFTWPDRDPVAHCGGNRQRVDQSKGAAALPDAFEANAVPAADCIAAARSAVMTVVALPAATRVLGEVLFGLVVKGEDRSSIRVVACGQCSATH